MHTYKMNKRGLVVLSLILVFSLLFSLVPEVKAQNDPAQAITGSDKLLKVGEQLSDESSAVPYLKQEWIKILEKSAFGKFLKSSEIVLKKADPFWQFAFGLNFSWSYRFLLTFMLYLLGGVFFYRILSGLAIWTEITHFIAGLALSLFISFTHLYITITDYIISKISLAEDWKVQLVLGAIILIIILVFMMISKNIKILSYNMKNYIEQRKKENKTKDEIAKNREEIAGIKEQVGEMKERQRQTDEVFGEVGKELDDD